VRNGIQAECNKRQGKPLHLRRITFVVLSVATAGVVVGAAFVLSVVLERSRSSDNPGSYRIAPVASDTKLPSRARHRAKTNRRDSGSPPGVTRTSSAPSSPSASAVLPAERRLVLSLLAARQRYLDVTTVTRYQRTQKNSITEGFCKWDKKRYRCTILELLPAPNLQQYVAACNRSAQNRAQRQECERQPPPSRTESSVVYEVSVDRDRCWSAVIADNGDPTGSAKLEGCLSAA
jgi:hypothetical protein